MDKKVIHSVFEESVKKYSLNTAIVSENRSITYDDLNKYSNRLSHLLQMIGCGAGTIVNVIIPSSIQLVASLLGVLKKGGIYLPVDLSFSEKRLKQVFSETCDGILIVTEENKAAVINLSETLGFKISHLIVTGSERAITLYSDKGKGLEKESYGETAEWEQNPALLTNGNSSNYIFYTSGSTGEGKAIEGANASLSHFIHWEIKEFGIDDSFRISQLTQATFDASLRDIFIALISGGTLYIPAPEVKNNPRALFEWLEKSRINLVHCVPSLFRVLSKELQSDSSYRPDLSQLKYLLMAGELLYVKDILAWRQFAGENVQLVNLYGATETTLIKTFYRIGALSENPSQAIAVGLPISNTIVAIIKDDTICKAGEIGEIYIKTPFATKGYYKNEALTNQCFVQNPLVKEGKDIVYKTGDLGRYLPDGNIEVLGRLDSQVKINGVRIELNEIEGAILKLEDITGVVVKAHRGDDNHMNLIAYYTGKRNDDLYLALAKSLNSHSIPAYFIYMDEFPLNMNGKVDKKALPLPEEIIMNGVSYEAPVGKMEEQLSLFWKEILGLKKIGRNISFFSIGGHSLRAIQLVSRIYKEFNVNLKITDIFTQKTIREQALFISESSSKEYTAITPVGQKACYELSSGQRRLWVLSQFEESSVAYNMPGVYVFEGELNKEALAFAFNRLIDRHESLRTVFKQDVAGNVKQYIRLPEDCDFKLNTKDLRLDEAKDKTVKAFTQDMLNAPFDLSEGPLMRAGLLQLENSKWILVYALHHIISDGWSIGIMMSELLQLYANAVTGKKSTLEPLALQYKDYAAWQQEQLSGELLQVHKKYWLKQFEGELPVLALPSDKPRPLMKTYNAARTSIKIDRGITEDLKKIAERENGTLFMALLSVLNALFYKYTNQEDIIIGSPIAGRDHLDLENQIGLYLNTLAFRTRFNGEESFTELFRNVKQVTLEAHEHAALPFDEIVDSLSLRRDVSRSPLFDVMLVGNAIDTQMQNIRSPHGLQITPYENDREITTKFDLRFEFNQDDDGLIGDIEYNTDVFNENFISALLLHFKQLLKEIVAAPSRSILELSCLYKDEKKQMLENWNDTKKEYAREKTLVDLFVSQALLTPGNTAVSDGAKQFTYKELSERSDALAARLTRLLKPGDEYVAVHQSRSVELIVSIMAILKTGKAYVPVEPSVPADRKAVILNSIPCSVLITDSINLSASGSISPQLTIVDVSKETDVPAGTISYKMPVIHATDKAYIIFTSGSTGLPKGVIVQHRPVINLIEWVNKTFSVNEKDRLLCTASVSFDLSVYDIFGMLSSGGCLRIATDEELKEPALLSAILYDENITFWDSAPVALQQLVPFFKKGTAAASSLRLFFLSGDWIPLTLPGELKQAFPAAEVIALGGATEATVWSNYFPVTSVAAGWKSIPYGRPIQNARYYILDKGLNPVPVGVEGDLYIGGEVLAAGYHDAKLSAERFIASPFIAGERIYNTGDKARFFADGNIEFLGRVDDQVKIRGYRIELGDIESALITNELIEAAVVVAKGQPKGERYLVAYIVSGSVLNIQMLRAFLSKLLPAYMIPEHFIQMEQLPVTANGKLNKKALPDPEGSSLSTGSEYLAATNETQAKLISVWEEVLGRERIGIKDNFFDLGGHSIKAVRVISKIYEIFGIRIALKDLFIEPTIEHLSSYIDTVVWVEEGAAVSKDDNELIF
jgi:amino acid adenylation domain-containing protein